MHKNFFPISIIVSSLIFAGAVLIINKKEAIFPEKEPSPQEEIVIRPIDESDNILGNPNAPIVIIEYSDFECPYCKIFHSTMQRIMEDFGRDGKVAWVYRHFPLTDYHENAYNLSMASECVGNWNERNLFWNFAEKIFSNPSPKDLNSAGLAIIANEVGMPSENFISCFSNQSHAEKINRDIEDGKKLYQNDSAEFGTPYNIILTKNGIITVSGAQPYNILRELILENL
jgi:protein-disulfide isomerase